MLFTFCGLRRSSKSFFFFSFFFSFFFFLQFLTIMCYSRPPVPASWWWRRRWQVPSANWDKRSHIAKGFVPYWRVATSHIALFHKASIFINVEVQHETVFLFQNIFPIWALTLILRRSRTGTVWFHTSTSNKRAARPKLYTKSLTRDLKRMYSRLTLVRISIKL